MGKREKTPFLHQTNRGEVLFCEKVYFHAYSLKSSGSDIPLGYVRGTRNERGVTRWGGGTLFCWIIRCLGLLEIGPVRKEGGGVKDGHATNKNAPADSGGGIWACGRRRERIGWGRRDRGEREAVPGRNEHHLGVKQCLKIISRRFRRGRSGMRR